ncbi:MAG: flagellar basal body P-ring formation chaperone FlgA [Sulfuricurvum sp.]|nr:flagellar basal body P-ring formation chaperone FlgA [Sulfuricurvum sp.]
MNKIFILIFLCLNLVAYELKENYEYNQNTIFSNDLFPDLTQKFEILKIPDEKTQYRVDAQVIAKTFELNGIQVDINHVRYINFTKHSTLDFTSVKQHLKSMLEERYPTIRITAITIHPRGYLASLPINPQGVFDKYFYQNGSGIFYITDTDGIRHYLDYTVEATINVLHTSKPIEHHEILSASNAEFKSIPFKSFRDLPLTLFPDEVYRFRTNLKPDQLLLQKNIEKLPLVLRNVPLLAEVHNGPVVIEFSATATQEGALYDIITILKSDGKRAKAKVIGENRVELQ